MESFVRKEIMCNRVIKLLLFANSCFSGRPCWVKAFSHLPSHKMIKVLIKESDAVYHWALRVFVTEHFRQHNGAEICFLDNADKNGMEEANVIIYGFRPGEILTCIPDFNTTSAGAVIGIYDETIPNIALLPACFQNMQFVQRSGAVDDFRSVLLKAWESEKTTVAMVAGRRCVGCRRKELSHQQRLVFREIGKGKSAEQIASELAITVKTVFSHKHLAMRKFNLNSDQQLLQFLSLGIE